MKAKLTLLVSIFSILLINASAQLTGTYTIGGVTPDYATISAAVTALQTQGVSGAVTLNIRPGTYAERVDIGTVTGVSASNTVTFQAENGDSTSVIITDSALATSIFNYTFHIAGTDFLIVKNLTIARPGTDPSSCVFSIGSNSRYLQIRNCIIKSNTITGTNASSAQLYMQSGTPNDSSIIISNNIFDGGSYGIDLVGQNAGSPMPLTQIQNNLFIHQSFRAISLFYCVSPVISGNIMSPASATSTTYRGVVFKKVNGDFKITENTITNTNGYPLQLDTCNGNSGSPALIANNFLHTGGTSTNRGIYVNFCSYLNVYHNSVNIFSTNATSSAFFINDNGLSTNLNVKNNIFINPGGGQAMRGGTNSLSSFSSCDYNDIWVLPSTQNMNIFDTSYVDLASWQAGTSLDSHSVSIDPEFFSNTDLHIFTTSVNNLGTYLTEVPADIEGDVRSITTPDIGADEFVPLSDNIGLESVFLPNAGVCGDSGTAVAVIIKNIGGNSQTNFSVTADITGSLTQTLTDSYSGTLNSNQSDTLIFLTLVNTINGGTFDIKAYTQLAGDQSNANDTVTGSFMLYGKPNAPTVSSPQQQCDNNLQVTSLPDTGDVSLWYDQLVGGTLLHVGDVLSVPVSTDTVFYVESKKASPTSGCVRITEVQLRTPNFVEIQNLSATTQDYTGWIVVVCGGNTNINTVNNTYWFLGAMNPGEVQYKSDATADNYWGNALALTTGGRGWVMILDPNGVIADFVSINYPADSLPVMNTTISGHQVTVGSEWAGSAITSCVTTTDDNQRVGTYDNNNVSDWVCDSVSKGIVNVGLDTVFVECGIIDCPSDRVPVSIIILSSYPVNLGNDTIVATPFSITLDAGPGAPYYFWSTGESTQTIVVDTVGTYWVSTVDTTGQCSAGDTIVINLNVGIGNDIGDNDVKFYPNPATDKFYIAADESLLRSATIQISDMEGRLVDSNRIIRDREKCIVDLADLNEGIYILHMTSGTHEYVKRFTVIR